MIRRTGWQRRLHCRAGRATALADLERQGQESRVTFDRIRKVMHVFKGEAGHRKSAASSGKLWHALHAISDYLTGQSHWLVNYAKRYRAGLRVGTSITEGTANFLVNRRMNKSQQMRWSRRGADLLLQVRCAVYNGALGPDFGNLFEPAPDTIKQPPTRRLIPQLLDTPRLWASYRSILPSFLSGTFCMHMTERPESRPSWPLSLCSSSSDRGYTSARPRPERLPSFDYTRPEPSCSWDRATRSGLPSSRRSS